MPGKEEIHSGRNVGLRLERETHEIGQEKKNGVIHTTRRGDSMGGEMAHISGHQHVRKGNSRPGRRGKVLPNSVGKKGQA